MFTILPMFFEHVQIALQHGCSPVNFLNIFRTPIKHIWRAASVFKETWKEFYISLLNLTGRNRKEINLFIILIIKSFY